MSRSTLVRLLAVATLAVALATVLPGSASAFGEVYRRWSGPKVATCQPSGSGGVRVTIDNQDVAFNDVPAGAQFTINYVRNGVTTTFGPYPVEQTSGTKAYGAFAEDFASYPFTFEFRLDTIVAGQVVYTSTLDLDCAADGVRTVSATNVSIGYGDPYRRWMSPKTLTCGPSGSGGVQAAIDNQNVEFNNLPADAQFTINYVLNGTTTTDGPYPVEQTNGTKAFGAFAQPFPSYPFTFEFRLDTLIDGEVVYTSTLDLGCTGDGTRTVTAVNEVVGPPVTTTTTTTTTPGSTTTTGAPGSTTTTTAKPAAAQAVIANPRFAG